MSGQLIRFTAADVTPEAAPDEPAFQAWYSKMARQGGLDPNPDAQEQLYDYRAAFRAGAKPDASGHWPSTFKKAGHPNEIVGGFNTRTGERVAGTPQASEQELIALGWDAATAKNMSQPREPVVNIDPEARGGFEGYNKVFDLLKSLVQPDNWPTIGGAAGGLVGGIGGTVGGMGVGGVPGAIGGATLGGGTGEAARQLFERFFGGGETPESPMEAAQTIGTEGGIQGALEGVGGAVVKGAGAGAQALYRGFLKPSLSKVGVKQAKQIVQTALDEGLPIAESGTRKANQLIRQLNTEVTTLLRASKGTVDLHQIAEKVRAFGRARYNRPGAPTADFESVMKVADTIDNHPSLGLPPGAKPTRVDVPATVANETKQTLDRAAGETAFGLERSAATEAQKQGRRATRDAIEQVEPAVAPLTARESRLIPARDAVERAVARESNRNALFGVPSLITGMGGATAVGAGADVLPTLIAAAVARSAMTPGVASRLAILAHKFAKVPGTIPADAVRMAERVLMHELGPEARQE